MFPIQTQEHKLLYEAFDNFLVTRCPIRWSRTSPTWSESNTRELWHEMAEMGWQGILLPESKGGLELGFQESLMLAERIGANLFPLPFGETTILSALVARELDGFTLPHDEILSGNISIGWLDISNKSSSYLLDHAGQCTKVILTKRLSDGGIKFAAINTDELKLESRQAMDPCCPLSEWMPDPGEHKKIEAKLLNRLSCSEAESALTGWRLYRIGELLGVARGAFELTVDYVKNRIQFDVPIGSFQAVKHKLANIALKLEVAELCTWDAAIQLDNVSSPLDNTPYVDYAHLAVVEVASIVEKEVIQLHGAMGFTWECDAHLYQKRIVRQRSLLPLDLARERLFNFHKSKYAN